MSIKIVLYGHLCIHRGPFGRSIFLYFIFCLFFSYRALYVTVTHKDKLCQYSDGSHMLNVAENVILGAFHLGEKY